MIFFSVCFGVLAGGSFDMGIRELGGRICVRVFGEVCGVSLVCAFHLAQPPLSIPSHRHRCQISDLYTLFSLQYECNTYILRVSFEFETWDLSVSSSCISLVLCGFMDCSLQDHSFHTYMHQPLITRHDWRLMAQCLFQSLPLTPLCSRVTWCQISSLSLPSLKPHWHCHYCFGPALL